MDFEEKLEHLREQFASKEVPEERSGIVVPRLNQPYFQGSTVPVVGGDSFFQSTSGLVVPRGGSPAPLDFMGTYITAAEYLETDLGEEVAAWALIHLMLEQQPLLELLLDLVSFSRMLYAGEGLDQVAQGFASTLRPDTRRRFEALLGSSGDGRRHFLARQPLLHAMRLTLTAEEPAEPARRYPPGVPAVLLVHAVAVLLGREVEQYDEELAGMDASLVMELVRNGFMNQRQDPVALIDRHWRIWTEYGGRAKVYPPRLPLEEMLVESAGITVLDVNALGFALWAHAHGWEAGRPHFLNPRFPSKISWEIRERFFRTISRTPNELRVSLRGWTSNWDFLEFERFPVAWFPQGLLILDEQLLLERFTDGLYWFVFDHERDRFGTSGLNNWRQTYGEIVELLVEDSAVSLSPPTFGGGSNYYTEEDFKRAYPGKICDGAIHFGTHLLLIEVVSGRLQTMTRISGSVEHFKSDTEKLVLKKARQLDAASTSFLQDQERLTGFSTASIHVLPLIVIGGGYPLNPSSMAFIEDLLRQENLLEDPRVEPLCMIDLEELEMLEALRERGVSVAELLANWKSSDLFRMPLKNYVLSPLSGHAAVGRTRPERMKPVVDELFDAMIARLGLRSPRKSSWPKKLRRTPR